MRKLFLILLFGPTLGTAVLWGQELTGEVLDQIHEKLAREMEEQFFAADSVVIAEEEAWEDFFRTSDLAGEDAVGYNAGLRPPKGVRIGCVCMDGTEQDERGRGACSGRGGVRFWLYQIDEDSIAYHPTNRHHAHPEPLSVMEINNLSSRNATAPEPPAGNRFWGNYRLEEVLIAMMVCLTIAYLAKLWFYQD